MRVQREIVRQQAHRLLDEVAAELAAARQPLATYRVQLHAGFTFEGAAAIARYLAELGITDLYTSPILRAAPGSMHGYDVLDYGSINPELGGDEGYERLAGALHEAGLGDVLDIVPNHKGVGSGNALWLHLLEDGPSAQGGEVFRIEGHPGEEGRAGQGVIAGLG